MLPRRAAARLLLALVVLATAHDVAQSYPTLWADLNVGCSNHPTKPEGQHKAPVPDSATKFLLTDAGVPIKELCPGLAYGVQVAFPEPRLGLLSVSVGSFVPEDPVCPDRLVELKTERSTTLDATLSVPCAAKGSAVLRVTSAAGSSAAFQDARATVPINPACAAATCAVDPPIAAAATTAVPASPAVVAPAKPAAVPPAAVAPAAAAKPAALPAAAAAAVAVAAPAAAAAAKPAAAAAAPAGMPARPASLVTRSPVVPGCHSSTLWYSCSVDVRGGGTIHYSVGPAPPDNVCTQRAAGAAADAAGQDMLHIAFEGGEAGYAGLGFTATPGKMCPSDVVIGSVAPDGRGSVASYNLQDYAVSAADETTGWASNMGVVKIGGKTVICFSRPLQAAAAKSTPKLDDAAAQMIWAASPETGFEKHNLWGSFSPDLRPLLAVASGAPPAAVAAAAARAAPLLVATDPMEIVQRNNVISQVHGALMLLAFLVLMPVGTLLARHKWLFGDDDDDGMVDPGWYYLHVFAQVMAILTAIAGTVLIMGWFGLHRQHINPLYIPHMALGLAATSAGIVQGIIGASRPPLAARQRATWRGVHYGWGWLTMLAGIANSGIGIALIHILHSNKLAYWIGPTVAAAAALALVAFGLEVKRSQLVRSGAFIPKEHAVVKPKYKAPANGGGYGSNYVASDAAAAAGGVPHV